MSDNMSQSQQVSAVEEPRSSVDSKPEASDLAQLQEPGAEHDKAVKDKTTDEVSANGANGANAAENIGNKDAETSEAEPATEEKVAKTSPKKRGAAGAAKGGSPNKKRAGTKAADEGETAAVIPATPNAKKARAPKKATPKVTTKEVKTEDASDAENATSAETEIEDDGDFVPMTPNKGARTPKAKVTKEPKTPKTPKTPNNAKGVKAENGTPTPKSSGKRASANKVADKVSLPTVWANASGADKALVKMKQEGKSWNEIRSMWKEMTNQDTA
ncbi:MAG: hypothetical protein Q9174_004884, partial [Haloplaca sp. 1 TL-2023]